MAAAITDLLTQATNGTRPQSTTLTAIRNIGAATISVGALTGWPTATACHFVIYTTDTSGAKVAGSQIDCKGIVSGATITNIVYKAGTDAGNSIGAIVECAPTAAWANDTVAGMTAQHTQLGAHTGITTDTIITTGAATVGNGLAATGAITLSGSWDGWIGANESWTFASATTITVPTDATTKYAVGDRIKLTQSATVKYFYIVGVAATVLTITGGADYTLANSAITLNAYSHMATPLGFPQWFNYTETWTGFSAAPSSGNSRFSIIGRMVSYNTNRTTPGTSSTNAITLTLPVTAATQTGGWSGMNGRAMDNGIENAAASLYLIASAGSTASLYLNNGSNWTASANKDWRGLITYEI